MDPEELKRAVLAMKNDDTALGVKAMVKQLKEMGDVDVTCGAVRDAVQALEEDSGLRDADALSSGDPVDESMSCMDEGGAEWGEAI